MKSRLGVPSHLRSSLAEFLRARGITIDTGDTTDCVVLIVAGPEREYCCAERLYIGGYITCATAQDLAERLGIGLEETGRLLDFLGIKIRACQLGCFS